MPDADAVLLDFGGTVDGDGLHWAVRFHAAYRAAGGTLDFGAFEPLFKESDRRLAALPGIRAKGFKDTVTEQARALIPLLPDGARVDAQAIAARFYDGAIAAVDRNRPTLERLAATRRLAVVSNWTGNLAPCLRELALDRYFTVATDSGVLGIEKPDPRIFLETLDALGVAPGRAWMVGDNFEADVRPAVALGMRACWVAPVERPLPPGGAGAARIAALPELEPLLA